MSMSLVWPSGGIAENDRAGRICAPRQDGGDQRVGLSPTLCLLGGGGENRRVGAAVVPAEGPAWPTRPRRRPANQPRLAMSVSIQ